MDGLFQLPDQAKPDYLAELVRRQDESEDLRSRIERLKIIGEILAEAWNNHPLCGKTGFPERSSNPMVRLEVHHAPGPRHGHTISCSFVRLSSVAGEMEDIKRKLRNLSDWTFQLMPVDPEDPVMGHEPKNPKLHGDSWMRVPRFWDFPNRAGLNFVARKTFKTRFPQLKPILAEAFLVKKLHNKIRPAFGKTLAEAGIGKLTTQKVNFQHRVARNLDWVRLLDRTGVTTSDIWALANNELDPADIERLGGQSGLFTPP